MSRPAPRSPEPSPATVSVEIYGSTYAVKGGRGAERLHEVADLVDGKMREVAAATGTADTAKIAILAALNLANELIDRRDAREGVESEFVERVADLTGALEACLDESAGAPGVVSRSVGAPC